MRSAQAVGGLFQASYRPWFFRQGKVVFSFSKRPESGPKVNRRMIAHLLERGGDD
jgi:hypothetical protein